MIESVFTVADKLHEVIADLCQPNYNGLCSKFLSASDIGSRLAAKLFNSGRRTTGFEIKNGEGVTNFNIYRLSQGTYTQVRL